MTVLSNSPLPAGVPVSRTRVRVSFLISALGALPSGRPSHRCDTRARRGRRCLSALFTPPPSSCRAVAAARERALRTRLALTVPPARDWPTADRRRDGRGPAGPLRQCDSQLRAAPCSCGAQSGFHFHTRGARLRWKSALSRDVPFYEKL